MGANSMTKKNNYRDFLNKIESMLKDRFSHMENGDYAAAELIRDDLLKMGYDIEDGAHGTIYKKREPDSLYLAALQGLLNCQNRLRMFGLISLNDLSLETIRRALLIAERLEQEPYKYNIIAQSIFKEVDAEMAGAE
jgi:hypothetical protein